MTIWYPSPDIYPSPTLFPGDPAAVPAGGYSQQIQVAIGSLALTQTDSQNVDWIATTLEGWWGSVASSLQLTQKSRAPGSWTSPRQLGSRTLTVAGYVQADSSKELSDAVDRLNAAASIDATILEVTEDNQTRWCIVYRQGEIVTSRINPTTMVWSMVLVAPDPRKFAAPQSVSTALASVVGGWTFPHTWPYAINSVVSAGSCSLDSIGNTVGPVTLRVDGPVAGPVITHNPSGLVIAFDSSLVLGAGEYLDIDTETQTALANGQTSRNPWLLHGLADFGWPGFFPGTNEWLFAASSYDPAAKLTASVNAAWQ